MHSGQRRSDGVVSWHWVRAVEAVRTHSFTYRHLAMAAAHAKETTLPVFIVFQREYKSFELKSLF